MLQLGFEQKTHWDSSAFFILGHYSHLIHGTQFAKTKAAAESWASPLFDLFLIFASDPDYG
jgi:catechol-2,3-dioxygenase